MVSEQPLAKDIDSDFADFFFKERLARELAGVAFLAEQRDVALIGGTGRAISPSLSPEPVFVAASASSQDNRLGQRR